jgi:hypothetical protein
MPEQIEPTSGNDRMKLIWLLCFLRLFISCAQAHEQIDGKSTRASSGAAASCKKPVGGKSTDGSSMLPKPAQQTSPARSGH